MGDSSICKTLRYIDCVSKNGYKLEFLGTSCNITAKQHVIIRPSIYHKDECLSCGKCCRNFDYVFFPPDFPEIEKLRDMGDPNYKEYFDISSHHIITVNGVEKEFMSSPPMGSKDSHGIMCSTSTLNCRWIFISEGKKYCRIHEYRPITCGFPHMELYTNVNSTSGYLGHKQFGRNWALGCKVDINQPLDQATLDSNIYWLTRLRSTADYLGIETFLPEMIEFLKTVDADNPPTESVQFDLHHSKPLVRI